MEHFVAGTTARTTAELVGVSRNTAALYFLKLRETVVELERLFASEPAHRERVGVQASEIGFSLP